MTYEGTDIVDKKQEDKGTRYITVLTPTQYRQLESKLGTLHVREDTSPIQVAYRLGIERVLDELRRGFVQS